MDLATGIRVECADGPCGRSRYVILDPAKTTITHVVVGESTKLGEARMVPLEYVLDSSFQRIRLKCTRAEFETFPQLSEHQYVKPEGAPLAHSPAELWMGPLTAYWQVLQPKETSP